MPQPNHPNIMVKIINKDLTLSSKFIPTETNWLMIELNLFRCSTTIPPSTIFMWNNLFIRKNLFKVDDFSYIHDREAIRSFVVFSFHILNVIDDNRESRTVPRDFLLSTSICIWYHHKFLHFPSNRLIEILLVEIIFYLHLLKREIYTIEIFNYELCGFFRRCCHYTHLNESLIPIFRDYPIHKLGIIKKRK